MKSNGPTIPSTGIHPKPNVHEGNVLFNDALNTWLYMVSDIWLRTIQIMPPRHGLLILINSKVSFICTIPQTGQHILTTFVTSAVEHWME